MRWLTKLLFAFLLLSGAALGQAFTQVSGIAQNSGGQIYQNCTYNVTFVGQSTQPGPYLLQGSTFQTSYAGVRCDGFGHFSIRLPSNQAIFPQPSSWMFNICDSTGRFCNTQGTGIITIAGAAQDITTIMAPLLPSIPTIGPGGAVESVFGRTGAVVAQTGDYGVAQVTGAAPINNPVFTGTQNGVTAATADSSTRLATTQWVKNQGYGTGTGSVTSVFGRTGVVTAATGDYQFSQIGGTLSASQLPTTGLVLSFNTRSGAVTPASGDYAVGQVTGAAPINNPVFTGTQNGVTAATADNSTRLATTAWVKLQGYSTGGAAGVTSFNTRTGAVVPTTGDYVVSMVTGAAPISSPNFLGTPTVPDVAITGAGSTQAANINYVQQYVAAHTGGGGGVNPGTVNLLPKYVTTTTVGPSLLSDDGTTLNYTGTGGIVAPKFSHGSGAFQLESVTGALPGLPGAGHNALVSGPDGWYISQANAAFLKIATVAAPAPAITLSPTLTPTCVAANSGGTTNITTAGSAGPGDTVIIGLSIAITSPSTVSVGDSGSSIYTLRGNVIAQPTNSTWLLSTGAGAAKAASTFTAFVSGTTKYIMCVAAYQHVGSIGVTDRASGPANANPSVGLTTQGENSFVFGMIGANAIIVPPFTGSVGVHLAGETTTAGGGAGANICHNTAAAAGPLSCAVSLGSTPAYNALALELRPEIAPGQPTAGVTSFNTRSGTVMPAGGDYNVAEVTGAAPLASPTFTGTPHGPTAAQTVNNTELATTAFVHAAVAAGGGAISGVSSFNTRNGAVVPATGDYTCATTATCMVTGSAPLASPALTGTPTAPTAGQAINNTQLATTAYVRTAAGLLAPLASPALTGTPTGPTATQTVSDTQLATTAFVHAAVAASTAGVSSFNTRNGAVVPVTGDYTCATTATCMVTGAAPLSGPAFTNAPTAPTAAQTVNNTQLATTAYVRTAIANVGGLSGTGNTNYITKWTGAGTLGQTLMSENADTGRLTYAGAEGIFTTAPPLDDTSNRLVNAYWVRNQNYAPLSSPAFTGTPTAPTAATNTNSTQLATTGFVIAQADSMLGVAGQENHLIKYSHDGPDRITNMITPSAVSDNGATMDYSGSGGITTLNPSPSDNSHRLATTAYVNNALSAGGIARIALSAGGSTCASNDVATATTLTLPVNITAADTVLVAVSNSSVSAPTTTTVTDNAAGGSNNYALVVTRNQGSGATQMTTTIRSPGAGKAKAATEMTVTQNHASKFAVCVAMYTGVLALGATADTGGTLSSIFSLLSVQDGGYVFTASGTTAQATVSWDTGTPRGTKVSTSPQPAGLSICDVGAVVAEGVFCIVRWSTQAQITLVAVELRPGVTATNNQQFPRVVAKTQATITHQDTAQATNYELCTPVLCPRGVYRLNFTLVGSESCTGGSVMPHLVFNDSVVSPPNSRNVALLTAPGMEFTPDAYAQGSRIFQNEGTGNIYVYTVGTNCSSGGAGGTWWIILERLW